MIKAEVANQGYRKGYDQAMEKSHQLEDRLQKRGAELEQLLGECIRHQYIDEARASHSWLIAAKKAVGFPDADEPNPQLWNVCLGTSVEDQKRADNRIPALLKVPAVVHFVSVEPLLEPVDLGNIPKPTA
jgi:protein gp37